MEQQAPNERIIARLQKLLALANDKRGNEHEAQVAMQMAQDLMTAFNLTMSELGEQGENEEGAKREKSTIEKGAMYEYQRRLMKAIAEANFCWLGLYKRSTISRGNKFFYQIIGREANVVATRVMFEYLMQTMERLVPINSNAERLSRFAISWKEGCAVRLCQRLKERREELQRESARKSQEAAAAARHPGAAPSTALVILEDLYNDEEALNNDFRMGYAPGTTAKSRRDWEARDEQREKERAAREAEAQRKLEEERARETPEERARREKKEAKEEEQRRKRDERWQRAYQNRQSRYWDRRDIDAYYAGKEAGASISLDRQVDRQSRRSIK